MRHVIALDVGGTGMKAALVGADGSVLHEARRPTNGEDGPDTVVAAVLDFATELRDVGRRRLGEHPAAAGLAVPGVVDEEAGVARWSANLGWRDVPLRRLLADRLGAPAGPDFPVALGHDVRAGALAEGRDGAAAGRERFLFVALGTGVAAALGTGGRIDPGAHGRAGELGHVVVRPGGPLCGCGRRGCLERIASASAVARNWAASGGDPETGAAGCAAAVEAGDQRARAVWSEAVAALADGLVVAVTLLDPGYVVVGGGLAGAGETLFAPLRDAVAERLTFQHDPLIVPAALGENAGCLGASMLARDLIATEVTA